MNLKKAAQKKLKKSGGFTLVEMLIVVAIIAILVVVSIPMISGSLDEARKATDDANMRAAKSAALVEYMTSDDAGPYFYNAAKGTVAKSDAGITGYNQAKQTNGGGSAATTYEKGKGIVQVTITEDDPDTTTNEFRAEANWVAAKG